MKRTILCTLSAALLGWAAAASSAPPDIVRFEEPFDFGIVDCGGFVVFTDGTQNVTFKTFFDKDGIPSRLQVSLRIIESRYYNSVDPTIFIRQGARGAGENVTINVDLATGDEHDRGLLFRITIPGVGPAFLQAGTFRFENGMLVFRAGPFIFPEDGTGSVLCNALSP